jgi:hypothetical protein
VQHSSLRSASSLGRSSKLSSFFFVQRVSLSFCAFLAGCFSHPYWLAGAGGFEPLHLEIRSAELHPASTGSRRRSGAPLIRDAQVRVPPPGLRVLAYSDSNMQRFESRRPSQPVRSLRWSERLLRPEGAAKLASQGGAQQPMPA